MRGAETHGSARRGAGTSTGAGRAVLGAGCAATFLAVAVLMTPLRAPAQEPGQEPVARPIPAPVVPPPFFRGAVEAGTRSSDGRPGPDYWTQWSTYRIETRLEPGKGLVVGSETVHYRNHSPDSLYAYVLDLYQNLHKEGSVRNEEEEITGGVDLDGIRLDGRTLFPIGTGPGPGYEVDGTTLILYPGSPLPPGGTADIEVGWSFRVPQSGAGRMGWSDRDVYFVGYWYPRMAVYDDLRGWDAEPYMGNGEFYDGFGDYHVSVTVPDGWTVMGTGVLENPREVYTDRTLQRIDAASTSDTVVVVADSTDRAGHRVTRPSEDGFLTYRFRADSVRDFAWSASSVQSWSATSAVVPDRDADGAEDRVLIHSLWRPDRAPLWREQALYAKDAIERHSRYTGFTYPWPHMTSVEGADIIGGGMEYPMMTLIGSYQGRRPRDLYGVTVHELAHMWIPMVVSTNERRHAWMDEGSTTYLEDRAMADRWPDSRAEARERESYLFWARREEEESMMRHGDEYPPGSSYVTASYSKPATLLTTLRSLLGEDAFLRAYRSFVADWAYKHPTPWDFFNAFERVADRDLDWFWTPFYYETWTLDHAVGGVDAADEGADVRVEDRGWAMLPARVRVTSTSGDTVERTVPVSEWLAGEVEARVHVPFAPGRIARVELDPERELPDVDRRNDVWTP